MALNNKKRLDESKDPVFDRWVRDTIELITNESNPLIKKGYALNLINECLKKRTLGIKPPTEFADYILDCFRTYICSLENGFADNMKKAFHIDGRVSNFDNGVILRIIVSEYVTGFKECKQNQQDDIADNDLATALVQFTDNVNDFPKYARAYGYQTALNNPKLKLNKARLVTLVERLLGCEKTKAHYNIDAYKMTKLIDSPIALTLTNRK